MGEHKEKRHKKHKCLMCDNISDNLEMYRKHKKKHEAELKVIGPTSYPGHIYSFKCDTCNLSFESNDNLMDHMHKKHLTEAQRNGDTLKKFMTFSSAKNSDSRPPVCKNGEQCSFHKQHRCNFFHALPPQERQPRHHRQAPSSQWQSMHSRRPQHNQGLGYQRAHPIQTQRKRQGGAPEGGTWCKHEDNCLQGRFCVLTRDYDMDFPSLPYQGRQ